MSMPASPAAAELRDGQGLRLFLPVLTLLAVVALMVFLIVTGPKA